MNGKGSAPRHCFSKQFKTNYDKIDWRGHRKQRHRRQSVIEKSRKGEEQHDQRD